VIVTVVVIDKVVTTIAKKTENAIQNHKSAINQTNLHNVVMERMERTEKME
jgi:hypothetical protein